uniref:Uncharacterized protein n=1 Tax=Romanomermis culicivorax TaxID=13658 RepID=A0A915J418_ROMCU
MKSTIALAVDMNHKNNRLQITRISFQILASHKKMLANKIKTANSDTIMLCFSLNTASVATPLALPKVLFSLNKNMRLEIDNIEEQLAPNAGNVLPHRNVFETHDTMPRKNPLRELRFDRPIHKAVSEHFSQSHFSPFHNFQLEYMYARMFYFKFFAGILTAACLEPSAKISRAYVKIDENCVHILVAYGQDSFGEMHSHIIHMDKSSGDNRGGINAFATSYDELIALGRQISQAERGIDIQTIKSHEYELIPQPTNVEDRMGVKMNLVKSERLEFQEMNPNSPPNAADLKKFEQIKLDPILRVRYQKIRTAVTEPDLDDLKESGIACNIGMKAPPPGWEIHRSALMAGYVHGILSSALPYEYYKKMLDAPIPAVSYNTEQRGMHLYFPATIEMPDEHLLFDTRENLIKKCIGYDVLNQLDNVRPGTQVTEYDLNNVANIKEISIPENSVRPFVTGAFKEFLIGHFGTSKENGRWKIQAEISHNEQNFKLYMELFKSEAVEAGARASNLKSDVEKGAFAISYNLANSKDDSAIMALSEEQKYLNTENTPKATKKADSVISNQLSRIYVVSFNFSYQAGIAERGIER